MLVLTRKIGQKIIIGEDIEIVLRAVSGDTAEIGIIIPDQTPINLQGEEEGVSPRSIVKEDDMLVLTRKVSEKIMIGDNIEIMVVSIIGDAARIGINAPKEIKIMRMEVLAEVRDQNLQAVKTQGKAEELKGLLPKKESNHETKP